MEKKEEAQLESTSTTSEVDVESGLSHALGSCAAPLTGSFVLCARCCCLFALYYKNGSSIARVAEWLRGPQPSAWLPHASAYSPPSSSSSSLCSLSCHGILPFPSASLAPASHHSLPSSSSCQACLTAAHLG